MNTNTVQRKDYLSQNTQAITEPLESGKGCVVTDVNGRKYLDCCSQTLNLSLGQCHERINAKVIEQIQRLTFASSRFGSEAQLELAEKIMAITPDELNKINFKNTSGSSANENAIKAARKKHEKNRVISLFHSHHGQTHEMMRISGKHFDKNYIDKSDVFFAELPYCFRCKFGSNQNDCLLECLDELVANRGLFRDEFSSIIVEPIMVDAGVIIPPLKYHQKLRDICDTTDMALIHDEVQTGFGWLGSFFAMDYYRIIPDIVSMGKAMGAGFPIAACLMKQEYDVLTYGEHEITYGAHPLSLAATIENINILEDGLLNDVKEKSKYCSDRLVKLKSKYSCIGETRGVGLLYGIEFCDNDGYPNSSLTKAVYDCLLERGIIFRISKVGANSNILQFKPPLVISYDEIAYALDTLDNVLQLLS